MAADWWSVLCSRNEVKQLNNLLPATPKAQMRKLITSTEFRFILVGGLATVTYGTLTLIFIWLGVRAAIASLLAYFISIVVSFSGHKYFTFRSDANAIFEIGKFLALSAIGLIASYLVMTLCEGNAVLEIAGVALIIVVIPIINYLVLKFWVFLRS